MAAAKLRKNRVSIAHNDYGITRPPPSESKHRIGPDAPARPIPQSTVAREAPVPDVQPW